MNVDPGRVSVIMPVIDEERHLRHAVEGILAQDFPGSLEVIIAVGPSRDHTRTIADGLASEYSNVYVVDNPTGKTQSRNIF